MCEQLTEDLKYFSVDNMNRRDLEGLNPSQMREMQVEDINKASTALINFGVRVAKNNPKKIMLWMIGLFICQFFSGFQVSEESHLKYEAAISSVNYEEIWEAENVALTARRQYERRKGWFWSCNEDCQKYKLAFEDKHSEFVELDQKRLATMRNANAEIGLLSTEGVTRTRDKFWEQYSRGKQFATRQSKWDAFFMG